MVTNPGFPESERYTTHRDIVFKIQWGLNWFIACVGYQSIWWQTDCIEISCCCYSRAAFWPALCLPSRVSIRMISMIIVINIAYLGLFLQTQRDESQAPQGFSLYLSLSLFISLYLFYSSSFSVFHSFSLNFCFLLFLSDLVPQSILLNCLSIFSS